MSTVLYSDDPVADAERYYDETSRKRLPMCAECNRPIETECFYEICDEYICEDCMEQHRHWTDDFLED